MEITRAASSGPARAARPSPQEAAPQGLGDRVSTSASNGAALSMSEHNGVQIELMKRMGVGRDPQQMMQWIGSHAGRFRDLIESKEAEGWRAQLRDPEQKAQALALIQEKLLQPPEGF